MPRTTRAHDVVLLLPPPTASLPKNGESSKMALRHPPPAPPTLDVLLLAHDMARQRGEQLDIEAYMTEEMRREWFARRRPFLPVNEGRRRSFEGDESEGVEGPARKKRRGMSVQDKGESADRAGPSPSSSHAGDAEYGKSAGTPSPGPAPKRARTSLTGQYWHQRRKSYLPDEPESSKPDPDHINPEATGVADGVVEGSANGDVVPKVEPEPEVTIVHPPQTGTGSGHWRRKPEAEVDKDEIQASASYWNTLLIRARKDRGPQWDYSTQSHQVDRHSRAYYTHMDKPPPEDTEPPPAKAPGGDVMGVGTAPGPPVMPTAGAFAALTRTGSVPGDQRVVSGGMAVPSLPFTTIGGMPELSRSHSISSAGGPGAALMPDQLPTRSDSLYPNPNSTPSVTPSAPSTSQLQLLHQQQQHLLQQQQREQHQLQQQQNPPPPSSQPQAPPPRPPSQPSQQQQQQQQQAFQMFQQHSQAAQSRYPAHLQHLQNSHLHTQYSSPTSTNAGNMPLPNLTPSPAPSQGMQTMSPGMYPSPANQGQAQGQGGGQRNSFSTPTPGPPRPGSAMGPRPGSAMGMPIGVNGNAMNGNPNGNANGYSGSPYTQQQPTLSFNPSQSHPSQQHPQQQQQAQQQQQQFQAQQFQAQNQAPQGYNSPAAQAAMKLQAQRMPGPKGGPGGGAPNPGGPQQQGQPQQGQGGGPPHPWLAQAQSMGLSLQQFQNMIAQHQAAQQAQVQQQGGQQGGQGQGQGQGGMNPQGLHAMGRPSAISLAQLTGGGGGGNGMRGGGGGGGPMLGGGGGG